jgi:hypothetical protein
MMRNKRAAVGEIIFTIYRIVLISLIALIVLGVSAVFYDYYIDVRDAEAVILMRGVVNCMVPGGELDLDMLDEDANFDEKQILRYCGFDEEDGAGKRFFVKVEIKESGGKVVRILHSGDSGLGWMRQIYGSTGVTKYRTGDHEKSFGARVVRDSKVFEGEIKVGVLVNHEF